MDIAEKLAEVLGYPADLPPRDSKKIWLRVDCPFCGGSRAQLNYEIDFFRCWRCMDKPITVNEQDEELAIIRFSRQIRRSVQRVTFAYGKWVETDDLEAMAAWLVYNYRTGKSPANDGGMLPEWEEEFPDEPWRVDGKVQSVLDRDLMNYAEHEKTWKEKTHLAGDMLDEIDAVEYAGPSKVYRMNPDLSKRRFDPGQLRRCELMRNGLGPFPGHCKWCNKLIADAVIPPQERKLRICPVTAEDLELAA